MTSQTLAERFWAKVVKRDSGCWEWTGSTVRRGYGQISVNGHNRRSTHVALSLSGIVVPDGMIVCHHCDNPSCVRPDHLFVGTHKDNVADMIAKGRMGTVSRPNLNRPNLNLGISMPGSSNPSSKLVESDVIAIRRLHPAHSIASIARRYRVSAAAISYIINKKAWKHVGQ